MIDLRSDALTLPTDEMWTAMRETECGWALVREDRTVCELEALAAELLGKEAGLFVPTGTVGNLIAMMVHAPRGTCILAEAQSHVIWAEQLGFADLAGVWIYPIDGLNGAIPIESFDAAIQCFRSGHGTKVSLLWLENSHNASGGQVLDLDYMRSVHRIATNSSVATHLDGARLFNAAAALHIPVSDIAQTVDSVMINLNKGLSAPYGAVLCGTADFIRAAQPHLRRLGGASVHQAGLLAAAGVVALRKMQNQAAIDNEHARVLANAIELHGSPRLLVRRQSTNIVLVQIKDGAGFGASPLIGHLECHGIRAYYVDDTKVRFVTHRHIGESDVVACAKALQTSVTALAKSPN